MMKMQKPDSKKIARMDAVMSMCHEPQVLSHSGYPTSCSSQDVAQKTEEKDRDYDITTVLRWEGEIESQVIRREYRETDYITGCI